MADSFCKSEKARLNEFTTNEGNHRKATVEGTVAVLTFIFVQFLEDTPLIAQFAANNTIDFLSASEMVYP